MPLSSAMTMRQGHPPISEEEYNIFFEFLLS